MNIPGKIHKNEKGYLDLPFMQNRALKPYHLHCGQFLFFRMLFLMLFDGEQEKESIIHQRVG